MKGEPTRGKHRRAQQVQPGRLRALRLAARYTQHALARACGVSVNTIWMLDNDRTQPSVAMLRKLRRLLRRVREDGTHAGPPQP